MATGFYELLGVTPEADAAAIRAAWQEQVATVVRKIRAAEARQLDLAPLEARREALTEAWAVLGDTSRRRRYDRFRELSRAGLPQDADDLWAMAGASMVDPAAAAALDVVRVLSSLRVGDGFTPPRPAEVEVTASLPVVTPTPPPARVEPEPEPVRRVSLRAPERLQLDTSVPADDISRLLDLFGPTGAFLRGVREARGISLDQLAAVSRISIRFLEALEQDAFVDLPSATFVRGYLRAVLRALDALPAGDETEEYIEDWMARYHRARD